MTSSLNLFNALAWFLLACNNKHSVFLEFVVSHLFWLDDHDSHHGPYLPRGCQSSLSLKSFLSAFFNRFLPFGFGGPDRT